MPPQTHTLPSISLVLASHLFGSQLYISTSTPSLSILIRLGRQILLGLFFLALHLDQRDRNEERCMEMFPFDFNEHCKRCPNHGFSNALGLVNTTTHHFCIYTDSSYYCPPSPFRTLTNHILSTRLLPHPNPDVGSTRYRWWDSCTSQCQGCNG